MNEPIKIALVGLGRAGWGMHTAELDGKTDKFKIVACCDIIPERVKKTQKKYGCKGYGSIEELVKDPEIELVDIATRTSDHYKHALTALEAGKNVLLEKPMCVSYEQAADLFSRANTPGKPRLFVRQQRRFEAAFTEVYNAVKSGKLGKVFEVNIEQRCYQQRNDWQTLSEYGGGQLLNWGPHIIDHALVLLDSPVKKLDGELMQVAAGGDCEDHLKIYLTGENDRSVTLCISGSSALNDRRHFSVYGSRGAIEAGDNYFKIRYIDPEQKLEPVVSDPGTPGDSFGSSGTFAVAKELNWLEEEKTITVEDLTVFWDYLYDSYRNNADFPIKTQEVLEIMKTISTIKKKNISRFDG